MSDFIMLVGDVEQQLALLDEDSVDCVVTSPPYWGVRDYGYDGQLGMEPTLGEHLDAMVRVFRAIRRVMKPAATLWLNYGDCYATQPNGRSAAATKAAGNDDRTFRDKPFSTVGPIRADGTGGKLKSKDLCMIPNRLAIALQDDGWWVRAENIWGKPNPMPDSAGRYRPSTAHEKVWLLTKTGNSFYDHAAVAMPVAGTAHRRVAVEAGAPALDMHLPATPSEKKGRGRKSAPAGSGIRSNESFNSACTDLVETRFLRNYEPTIAPIVPPEVWAIPTVGFSEAHFATFPPALVVPCILGGCPPRGVVLDPFGGSGTTALVAQALGRSAILIEMDAGYAAMAVRRVRNGNLGFDLGVEVAE